MTALPSPFVEQKYVIVRGLLNEQRATELYDHALDLVGLGQWSSDDQVPESPALYAERRMEELLDELRPRIEATTGLALYPTYSYLRVYKHGDALEPHLDRDACEITVSVNLGYEAAAPWPLWIQAPAGRVAVQMEPGDALIYRGAECAHWREAFTGERTAQVLLHYVDQLGAHAEWRFDKRRRLNVPASPTAMQS
jgi:hypothetical protein